jgi:hypothetical protein
LPKTHYFKVECWGASGGNAYIGKTENGTPVANVNNTVYGGKGGYVSGETILTSSLSVYIYVGQTGEETINHTFNGGGSAATSYNSLSGGGATDIRLVNGNWNNFNSLKSRIIVAGGGGGSEHYFSGSDGGNSGGLSGQNGPSSIGGVNHQPYTVAEGGNQISGGKGGKGCSDGIINKGSFGIGGDHDYVNNHGGGGGGGYYGGGGGGYNSSIVGSGAGGSSFISGHTGCNAISESSTSSNIIHTGQPNHYSGYVFTNTVMKAGNESMPSPTGGTETGHTGNGYAKITWMPVL